MTTRLPCTDTVVSSPYDVGDGADRSPGGRCAVAGRVAHGARVGSCAALLGDCPGEIARGTGPGRPRWRAGRPGDPLLASRAVSAARRMRQRASTRAWLGRAPPAGSRGTGRAAGCCAGGGGAWSAGGTFRGPVTTRRRVVRACPRRGLRPGRSRPCRTRLPSRLLHGSPCPRVGADAGFEGLDHERVADGLVTGAHNRMLGDHDASQSVRYVSVPVSSRGRMACRHPG